MINVSGSPLPYSWESMGKGRAWEQGYMYVCVYIVDCKDYKVTHQILIYPKGRQW